MSARPATLVAYGLATAALAPLVPVWLGRRVARGKEDPERLGERRGIASRPRPAGALAWVHGASVGESTALLPTVEALVGRGLKVLVTSGTLTSADILARRLPPGARHQFLPLDVPRFVARFLDHWQPDVALFAESEIWPNMIVALHRRRVPLILVNARMSARSLDGWLRVPEMGRALFGRLALCLPQSGLDAERYGRLGAPVGPVLGNLKFDIAPLPADPRAVERLAGVLAGRSIWMAASTHPGEEEAVIAAHLALRKRRPGLLTILAPRHPARADDIADYATSAGLSAARRTVGETPGSEHDLFLVDTIGELGLFYRLVPLVFMGGSLVPHGGQNPIEPSRLGAAVVHGPHVENFAEIYEALDRAGGALGVTDEGQLARAVDDLLGRPDRMRSIARKAVGVLDGLGGALARTVAAIEPYLPPARPGRDAIW